MRELRLRRFRSASYVVAATKSRSSSTQTCRMRRSKRFRASRWATWSRSRYGSGRRCGSEFESGAIVVGGGNARAALSAPVDDTMFFAGEAPSTDDQDGTVNGALETGERAAAEAATALGVEAR